LEILQENIGETLEGVPTCNGFLNRTPRAPEITAKTDKLDCIKLKSFCISKETIPKMEEI
jgi:hypothetical protein